MTSTNDLCFMLSTFSLPAPDEDILEKSAPGVNISPQPNCRKQYRWAPTVRWSNTDVKFISWFILETYYTECTICSCWKVLRTCGFKRIICERTRKYKFTSCNTLYIYIWVLSRYWLGRRSSKLNKLNLYTTKQLKNSRETEDKTILI